MFKVLPVIVALFAGSQLGDGVAFANPVEGISSSFAAPVTTVVVATVAPTSSLVFVNGTTSTGIHTVTRTLCIAGPTTVTGIPHPTSSLLATTTYAPTNVTGGQPVTLTISASPAYPTENATIFYSTVPAVSSFIVGGTATPATAPVATVTATPVTIASGQYEESATVTYVTVTYTPYVTSDVGGATTIYIPSPTASSASGIPGDWCYSVDYHGTAVTASPTTVTTRVPSASVSSSFVNGTIEASNLKANGGIQLGASALTVVGSVLMGFVGVVAGIF